MPKKRKLNSKNPIYQTAAAAEGPQILNKVRMKDAIIRDSQMKPTGGKAKVYAVFYKNDEQIDTSIIL